MPFLLCLWPQKGICRTPERARGKEGLHGAWSRLDSITILARLLGGSRTGVAMGALRTKGPCAVGKDITMHRDCSSVRAPGMCSSRGSVPFALLEMHDVSFGGWLDMNRARGEGAGWKSGHGNRVSLSSSWTLGSMIPLVTCPSLPPPTSSREAMNFTECLMLVSIHPLHSS